MNANAPRSVTCCSHNAVERQETVAVQALRIAIVVARVKGIIHALQISQMATGIDNRNGEAKADIADYDLRRPGGHDNAAGGYSKCAARR